MNKKPIEIRTDLDEVMIMINEIRVMATHLIKFFFKKRKNGVNIIIAIARSLGFHWNPVGGCIKDGIKNESKVGWSEGSLPNKLTIFEKGDIGNLNDVKDSNVENIIWIEKIPPRTFIDLLILFSVLMFITIYKTIPIPQKI